MTNKPQTRPGRILSCILILLIFLILPVIPAHGAQDITVNIDGLKLAADAAPGNRK